MSQGQITGNLLLDGLPAAALMELRPSLSFVELPTRMILERRGHEVAHLYFPASGVASVVVGGSGLPAAEAGLIGREGLVGTSVILEDELSLNDVIMQVAGHGWRVEVEAFRAVMERPAVRQRMLRFLQCQMAQMFYTSLAYSRAKLETRLARWILMCHDRMPGDEFDLTHEFMALMLGVRRAGVTVALHELEGRGYLRSTRGHIEIRDRKALELSTDGFYGPPEAEYERLLPHNLQGDIRLQAGETQG